MKRIAKLLRTVADRIDPPKKDDRIGVSLTPAKIAELDGFELPREMHDAGSDGLGYYGGTYL